MNKIPKRKKNHNRKES